ncbi:MAG: adenosylmethionine--8-amino-7-oxononanoate transaminase [Proteobacteria bacterium]|nr:adenosylmethionine--8-amino-7-oxononanoate transaminase [Pseudomonadota bacterium]
MNIKTAKNYIELGQKHIWLPYTQMQNHLPQLEVLTAKDSRIFLANGKTLIDGISSWWSTAHGYNHPHIIKEICNQAKNLPHIMLAGFAANSTYKLAHRLCEFSKMDKIFFSDSGSTAIEVAMKICWQFHINSGEKNKTKFISFKNSYHGDTTGAMSLADLTSGMHQKFENILLDNFSLDLPQNKKDLIEFENFIVKNKNILAGIFIEPLVQCAGGMVFHTPEILREIFNIAKKHEILFVADECAVGFYRLGKKFACDYADIKPDILVLGKALTGGTITLAATLVQQKIFDKFLSNSIDSALMHGPTFMGNPLAAAAANASLDIFELENYQEKVFEIENFLKTELEKCRNLENIKDVRVLGAIGVVEISGNFEKMLELRKKFIADGIFLRPFANCVYVMPALSIKKSELKKITNSIYKNLHETKKI